MIGIDIAWDRPTVAQIKATGAKWVARYLSNDGAKNLTAVEVTEYAAAGLGTVVVWETTTGRATAGFAAGQTDARAAEAQRKAVGLPAGMPIHFAVDEDTTWGSVSAYFSGAASVLGASRVGVYGGYAVVEGAHTAGYRFLWQTTAWSVGRWSVHATIRQTGGTALGGGADYDQAMAADFGQYPRPAATPTPAPAPTTSTYLEDDVYAYLPLIPANATVDIPVEPAGTSTAPQGGAKNGPIWLSFTPQGADGTVAISEHTAKGWGTPVAHPVTVAGGKLTIEMPLDGSVDKVRLHPTVPLIGYLVGRQVA